MIDTSAYMDMLAEGGVEKLAGVPCSFLGPLIHEARRRNIYEPFVNEGDALAYAAGASLAGHACAVLMQNSGFSNALSPLTSLNELFGLHTLLIIGNRGVEDEPQHRIMGGAVKPILDVLNIPYFNAEDEGAVQSALEQLAKRSSALLVNGKDVFSPVSPAPGHSVSEQFLFRHDFLEAIAQCADDAIIVTTTGFTSREMFSVKDRGENFYMVGSMGCLSSFAMGIANYYPDKRVLAIDGDSACLMRLGALYTLTQKQPENLCYLVLDNEANESTGGQPNSLGESRLYGVMNGLFPTDRVENGDELKKRLREFGQSPRYTQLYARIRTGTREGLPRPDRQLIWGQAERFRQAVVR